MWQGFTTAVKALLALGLLDSEPHANLHPSGPELTWVKCQ